MMIDQNDQITDFEREVFSKLFANIYSTPVRMIGLCASILESRGGISKELAMEIDACVARVLDGALQ